MTSRSYFGKMNSTLGSVVPLAMFNNCISHPGLSFISFQMKFNYPVPSHFQFRVGTGRVLKKKFGTGRVPGSRRTLSAIERSPASIILNNDVYKPCVNSGRVVAVPVD